MTTTATGLAARTLDPKELRVVIGRISDGPHATISAGTRTRQLTALASVTGDDFELLMPADGGSRLITGPADRLGGELVGLITMLEDITGTGPTTTAPPTIEIPPLSPGELLALAEVIRQGDPERIEAGCDELELAGLPWWITQFAWGAEAILTLRLTADTIDGYATMLHLLPDGWGCLQVDSDDDLTFRPMTTIEVQARISAFAALLQGCSHDED